ncbi:hypothetical protein ZWY2020_036728 [Hordeum vulgare]|nr:hypothetical protein ZWY2020_036728 [Hordeum vulgare]
MLDAATRAAGGLARSLVIAAFGAAGTVIGGVLGLLWGFANEDGLLQGTVVGAVTGALVSVELSDSSSGYGPAATAPWTRASNARQIEALQQHHSPEATCSSRAPASDGRAEAAVESLRRRCSPRRPPPRGSTPPAPSASTSEFQAGESARRLPACGHVFHLACIDSWLLWKPHCPMCRHAVY